MTEKLERLRKSQIHEQTALTNPPVPAVINITRKHINKDPRAKLRGIAMSTINPAAPAYNSMSMRRRSWRRRLEEEVVVVVVVFTGEN